jgi:hypothetical protein
MSNGTWQGTHHDRRRTKCPSDGYGQLVQADVRLQQDLAQDPPMKAMVLELYTSVVSSAMQVVLPDGSIRIIEHYTDIFSPHVDFVGRFRYFEHFEGEHPIVGEPYTFTLLDMFGNPISGTESTDVFWRCTLDAPWNLEVADADYGKDVTLTWDSVPIVDGEFNPLLQGPDSNFHLPYQINIGSVYEYGSGEFGALTISEEHLIPWDELLPGSGGNPDGFDFGQPLREFAPGLYEIILDSWNMPDVERGGHHQDCAVYDSSETLFMEISQSQLTFTPSGSLSGIVTQSNGAPIPSVWVDACDYHVEEDPICRSAQTNENGIYRITGLLPGDYRVSVWGGQGGWIDEFFEEIPFYDQAQPVTVIPGVDTGDINFTMEIGGSISGHVTDTNGDLAFVHVDACDWDDTFCMGADTDENGNYTIFGLPAGDYRVSVWGGQGGWIDEFFEETPFYDQANPVTVSPGEDTGDVDFTMELAGSISGMVFDLEGNPLGGIAVDTESGGYGTCTDENGFYSLDGLPLGSNFNVVAGRDFCNQHPFEEQTRSDVEVSATEVDFFLAEGYHPTLHVVPAHPEVHGHEWNLDAMVTITVDDDYDPENGFLYEESKWVTDEPTWCGYPCFDLSSVLDPGGILPGYVVTMTDGEVTRVVETTSLVWTGTKLDADKVYGTADPASWIEVSVHGLEWAQRLVQADTSGYWEADFSVPGVEAFEQNIVDLSQGYNGRAIQFEGGVPNDGTLAYWHIPEFTIVAHPDHEWVSSHGWNIGEQITLYLDDNANPEDEFLLSMTQTAVESQDELGVGIVDFSGWEPFDLTSGKFVIVTNGVTQETLEVESLTIDSFDESLGSITGTAPPDREVGVGVHQPSGDFWMIVTSDSDGNWFVDFESGELNGVFDIHAMIWDRDGDATQANFEFEPQ